VESLNQNYYQWCDFYLRISLLIPGPDTTCH
jgi:hypothetical protein